MAQVKGIDFVVSVNTGTDALPVWTKIAGQRGATLSRSAETLETTSKDSQGFKEFEAGFKEWSIETEGLFVDGDAGFAELEDAFMNGTKLKVQIAYPNGSKYEGLTVVTDLGLDMPYDDMATASATFTGSGLLTKVTV